MKRRAVLLGLLGALGWGSAGGVSSGAEPPHKGSAGATPEKRRPPDREKEVPTESEADSALRRYPPAQLRLILRQQMAEHGGYLLELVSSVTLLQYDQVQRAAQKLANQPRLAAPVPGSEDDLNTLIPRQFFTYQDQLRQRAAVLAAAAGRKDDRALGVTLGQMMQVCVSCHSRYLRDTGEP